MKTNLVQNFDDSFSRSKSIILWILGDGRGELPEAVNHGGVEVISVLFHPRLEGYHHSDRWRGTLAADIMWCLRVRVNVCLFMRLHGCMLF